MEQEIILEKLDTQAKRQDDMRNQLDKDRADIDQLRMDVSAIKEGQQAQLKQMVDFKQEIRQEVKDTLSVELPKIARKVIREEIRLLSKNNPKKRIEGKITLWDKITKIFKR